MRPAQGELIEEQAGLGDEASQLSHEPWILLILFCVWPCAYERACRPWYNTGIRAHPPYIHTPREQVYPVMVGWLRVRSMFIERSVSPWP